MRLALTSATVVIAVACGDTKTTSSSPRTGDVPSTNAWVAPCVEAIDRARAAPPHARVAAILSSCRPCGVAWTALAAPSVVPGDVLEIVDACGGACSPQARTHLSEALHDLATEGAPNRPWRQLAHDCPAAAGVDAATARYASATWYALAKIAAGLGAQRASAAPVQLPVPVRSAIGTAPNIPLARAADARRPRWQLTITSAEVRLGAMPTAELAPGRLSIVDAGEPYPGEAVALDAVGARLDALTATLPPGPGDLDGVLVIAPRRLPATRVLEVVRALGDRRAYLAVALATPDAGWADLPRAAAAPLAAAAAVTAATTAQDLADRLASPQ